MSPSAAVRRTAEVADALRSHRPVVALESSVLAQGLPIPANAEAAERMTGAITVRGAIPAVTAVSRGVPTAGLDAHEMTRFLTREGVRKVSARDLAFAVCQGADGATTVAAGIVLAALAGIAVFATGGIGGVHRPGRGSRSWVQDESPDLLELARTPILLVCAGVKSMLDLPATHERLESLGVPVVGYRTSELPGFFTAETGVALSARADSATDVAAAFAAHRRLGRPGAMVVVQPPPGPAALDRRLVDAAVEAALTRAAEAGVQGGAVTPYLLAALEHETAGASLGANLALLEANAALAAEIAVALAAADVAGRGGVGPGDARCGIELACAGIVL